MTSGGVKKALEAVLADPDTAYRVVSKVELQGCLDEFSQLISMRNALIHAHPITDHDGSQVLSYQAAMGRQMSDIKWPLSEVEVAIRAFDSAACSASRLLHSLLGDGIDA